MSVRLNGIIDRTSLVLRVALADRERRMLREYRMPQRRRIARSRLIVLSRRCCLLRPVHLQALPVLECPYVQLPLCLTARLDLLPQREGRYTLRQPLQMPSPPI